MHLRNVRAIGRFYLLLPDSFQEKGNRFSVGNYEINEEILESGTKRPDPNTYWDKEIKEIRELSSPENVKNVILEVREKRLDAERAVRGVWYYYDDFSVDEAAWKVLLSTSWNSVWFGWQDDVDEKEKMWTDMMNLAASCRDATLTTEDAPRMPDWFYLGRGALAIPAEVDEEAYVRFENEKDGLKLEVNMNTVAVVKKQGLLGKLGALFSGYAGAFGVGITKLRKRRRVVAGLNGEEAVMKMNSSDAEEFSFSWRFEGEVNSGDRPHILITMDSVATGLEEKMGLWDKILDSMEPFGR